MKKTKLVTTAIERGIRGQALETLINYFDKKKLSRRNISIYYFVRGWEIGMRGEELEKVMTFRNNRKAYLFLASWRDGMRGEELEKLANYSNVDHMYVFNYAWGAGMRGEDLKIVESMFIEKYENIVCMYINCWKHGMRGEELEQFLNFCKHFDFNNDVAFLYLMAYENGIRCKALEKLFELSGAKDIVKYINGWNIGLRDEELENYLKKEPSKSVKYTSEKKKYNIDIRE